jgi:hypothetical protein
MQDLAGWGIMLQSQKVASSGPHYGPGVDWSSNGNEYQESSWG